MSHGALGKLPASVYPPFPYLLMGLTRFPLVYTSEIDVKAFWGRAGAHTGVLLSLRELPLSLPRMLAVSDLRLEKTALWRVCRLLSSHVPHGDISGSSCSSS